VTDIRPAQGSTALDPKEKTGKPFIIPVHRRAINGRDLYDWYVRQRELYAKGKLSEEEAQRCCRLMPFWSRVMRRNPN